MSKCSRCHLQYFYNASAYGFAGEIERPMRHSIPMQASATLAGSGGRGFHRIENFSAPPYLFFDAAYAEVGGSFDECHNQYTTFAYSVIEGLNIAGMITADRIVARMAIYSPAVNASEEEDAPEKQSPAAAKEDEEKEKEHRFDITGSYFENLRVAGQLINVQLATHHLLQYEKYNDLAQAMQDPDGVGNKKVNGADYHVRDLQPWGNLDKDRLGELEGKQRDYHALIGFGAQAKRWNEDRNCHGSNGVYWLSAAGHHELDPRSGLTGFGGIICIPKFGVVRLAEIVVHKHHRRLQMLRVDMCSTSSGNATGGGAGGGGSAPPPG